MKERINKSMKPKYNYFLKLVARQICIKIKTFKGDLTLIIKTHIIKAKIEFKMIKVKFHQIKSLKSDKF